MTVSLRISLHSIAWLWASLGVGLAGIAFALLTDVRADPAPAANPALPPAATPTTVTNLIPSTATGIPSPPEQPTAAKAFAVFDSHCAQCHQAGKLTVPQAQGGLADILALSALAKNSALVAPRSPDTSRLYNLLLQRHAPVEVYATSAAASGPSASEIETVRDWIESLPPSQAGLASVPSASKANQIRLTLEPEHAAYRAGDIFAVKVTTDTDCHVTLINIDSNGKATVIFPNEFEPNNKLRANEPRAVPAASAPYQLKFKDPGRETIVGLCSKSRATPAGISHDYERQRFTVLGNWRNFVSAVFESELQEDRTKDRKQRAGNAKADPPAAPQPAASLPRSGISDVRVGIVVHAD